MSSARNREIDSALQKYWLEGGAGDDQISQLIPEILSEPPSDLWVAARSLKLVGELGSSIAPVLASRITDLERHVADLRELAGQVDALGDMDTPPEVLFKFLGADGVDLLLSGFDSRQLAQARVGAPSRPEAALRLLRALKAGGSGRFADLVRMAESLAARAEQLKAQALFLDADGRGYCLGIFVEPSGSGPMRAFANADKAMLQQAKFAFDGSEISGRWLIEWPTDFGGESIGVGLAIARLVVGRELKPDPLLAATGALQVDGRIVGVTGIDAKLHAAADCGIRRVVLSAENEEDATEWKDRLDLIFVRSVAELKASILNASTRIDLGFDGLIGLTRHIIPAYGMDVTVDEAKQGFHRFKSADADGEVIIDIWPTGTAKASGTSPTTLAAANKLIDEHLRPLKPQPRRSISRHVPAGARRERFKRLLVEAGGREVPAQAHESWRIELQRAGSSSTAVLYASGSSVIQGHAPAFDEIARILGECLEGLGGAEVTTVPSGAMTQEAQGLDASRPHIGTDEAGKGDFFGPLVCAAVYVDGITGERLTRLGIKDSKMLSDKTIRSLAADLRRILGSKASVTTIPPRRFNTLFREMKAEGKNLNTLLAWGHTRSIEDLIKRGLKPDYIIIDQFGDRRYIERKLLADTRESGIPIVQTPKAEADVAVAAASVMARDGFLDWLDQAAARLGKPLPKGSSPQAIERGREIVAASGPAALEDLAKTSFKTMVKVLER